MATFGAATRKAADEYFSFPTPQQPPPTTLVAAGGRDGDPCPSSRCAAAGPPRPKGHVCTPDIPEISLGTRLLPVPGGNPFRVHPRGCSFTMAEYNSAAWQTGQATRPSVAEAPAGAEVPRKEERGRRSRFVEVIKEEEDMQAEDVRAGEKKTVAAGLGTKGTLEERKYKSIASFVSFSACLVSRLIGKRHKGDPTLKRYEEDMERRIKHTKCETQMAYVFGLI